MFQNLIDDIHLIITSKYPNVSSNFGVCCISVFYAENSDPIYCKIFHKMALTFTHLSYQTTIYACMCACIIYICIYIYKSRNIYFMYLGKLSYFTNLNSSAIWGWFPLLTMIPVRENSEMYTGAKVERWCLWFMDIPAWGSKHSKVSLAIYPQCIPIKKKKNIIYHHVCCLISLNPTQLHFLLLKSLFSYLITPLYYSIHSMPSLKHQKSPKVAETRDCITQAAKGRCLLQNASSIGKVVGKTIINHSPVITIFKGGMLTIPSGW